MGIRLSVYTKHRQPILVAALAALTYNNWVLGHLLNRNLFERDGSVSEFSVSSQPYHWLFQSLDIVSGSLLVLVGYCLWQSLSSSRSGRYFAIGAMLLGAANIFDAVFSLPCSETLSATCQIPINISLSGYQVPAHAYTSTLIGMGYLLLPLSALVYAYRRKIAGLIVFSLVLVSSSLFSLTSILDRYIRGGGPTAKASGGSQEAQMLLLGAWLIYSVYQVYTAINRPAIDPAETKTARPRK